MQGMACKDAVFIHPVCDQRVMSGNATVGLEILEDLPDVDAVIVPFVSVRHPAMHILLLRLHIYIYLSTTFFNRSVHENTLHGISPSFKLTPALFAAAFNCVVVWCGAVRELHCALPA